MSDTTPPSYERRRSVGRRRTDAERLAIVEVLVDRHDEDISEIRDDVKGIRQFVERARVWGTIALVVAPYIAQQIPPIHHHGG